MHGRELFGQLRGRMRAPLKIIFEGDSITFYTNSPVSMANQWIAANPKVPAVNLSVAGARIRANGGNSLDERRAGVKAAAAGTTPVLCLLIGANDLYVTGSYPTVADWQNSLLALLAAYRADTPGILIGVGTILPVDEVQQAGRAGFNARRAVANAWLRGQVGGAIDFLIPYGDGHPVMGLDATAATGTFTDGLHPSTTGASHMLATLSATLAPIVAAASGEEPGAFAFADFASATASTQYSSQTVVTGMGPGRSCTASVTGAGVMARGAEPAGMVFGTGPVAVCNGDIVTSRLTSSADAATLVRHTLTLGTLSDDWDVTTTAAPATTVWDQAFGVATLHYVDTAGTASAREVHGPLSGESGYNSTRAARASKGFTIASAAKRCFELRFTAGNTGSSGGPWSVSVLGNATINTVRPGSANNNGSTGATYRSDGIVTVNGASSAAGAYPPFGAADAVMACVDTAASKVWFLKNGVSINGDPAAGTGGFALYVGTTSAWYAGATCQRNEGHLLNCGQDPFASMPPAGFTAWG